MSAFQHGHKSKQHPNTEALPTVVQALGPHSAVWLMVELSVTIRCGLLCTRTVEVRSASSGNSTRQPASWGARPRLILPTSARHSIAHNCKKIQHRSRPYLFFPLYNFQVHTYLCQKTQFRLMFVSQPQEAYETIALGAGVGVAVQSAPHTLSRV